MVKILMVCLGNICRSPLAHGILESKLPSDQFLVDSAGTANYHIGEAPIVGPEGASWWPMRERREEEEGREEGRREVGKVLKLIPVDDYMYPFRAHLEKIDSEDSAFFLDVKASPI